jgi:hypothetical protein
VLGFVDKQDNALEQYRWLTVVSPEALDGIELLLEPNANGAARDYQLAMHTQGITVATVFVDDLAATGHRLAALGVDSRGQPMTVGGPLSVVFDDTCGNLIQLVQG